MPILIELTDTLIHENKIKMNYGNYNFVFTLNSSFIIHLSGIFLSICVYKSVLVHGHDVWVMTDETNWLLRESIYIEWICMILPLLYNLIR